MIIWSYEESRIVSLPTSLLEKNDVWIGFFGLDLSKWPFLLRREFSGVLLPEVIGSFVTIEFVQILVCCVIRCWSDGGKGELCWRKYVTFQLDSPKFFFLRFRAFDQVNFWQLLVARWKFGLLLQAFFCPFLSFFHYAVKWKLMSLYLFSTSGFLLKETNKVKARQRFPVLVFCWLVLLCTVLFS